MFGVTRSIKHLKVFGCLVYRWLARAQRKSGKWVGRASPCALVGFTNSSTIYRLYNLENTKTYECSHCVFREDIKAWSLQADGTTVDDPFNGIYEFNDDDELREFKILKFTHCRVL